jgi:hypothetical protein
MGPTVAMRISARTDESIMKNEMTHHMILMKKLAPLFFLSPWGRGRGPSLSDGKVRVRGCAKLKT